MKGNFSESYHQHGVAVHKENQSITFFFAENPNYTQVGNGYLDFEKRVRKANDNDFVVSGDNTIEGFKLVNNAFAFTIQYARTSISSPTEINTKQVRWTCFDNNEVFNTRIWRFIHILEYIR